jgi:hypothetical protein
MGEILPAGGDIYLFADLEDPEEIGAFLPEELRENKNAGWILRRTRGAAAVFFPGDSAESSESRFFAAVWGRYPHRAVNLGLAFNRSWKRTASPTGKHYWHSRPAADQPEPDRAGPEAGPPGAPFPAGSAAFPGGLSLALGSGLALLSDGDPFSFSPGPERPEAFGEFRRDSVLSGWLPAPAPRINRFLEALEIPIMIPAEELLFALVPLSRNGPELPEAPGGEGPAGGLGGGPRGGPAGGPEGYELLFRIKTPSVSQARALVTLFSMARLFMPSPEVPEGQSPGGQAAPAAGEDPDEALRAVSSLFALLPVQEGVYLTLRSGPMDAGRAALLFRIFSVYSIQNQTTPPGY